MPQTTGNQAGAPISALNSMTGSTCSRCVTMSKPRNRVTRTVMTQPARCALVLISISSEVGGDALTHASSVHRRSRHRLSLFLQSSGGDPQIGDQTVVRRLPLV